MKSTRLTVQTKYRTSHISLLLAACLFSSAVTAATLDLADAPLYVTNSVKPNIMLAVDDSGSMDSEVIFPSNDGALWWHTGINAFIGNESAGVVNFNEAGSANGTWKKFTYLFPNGVGSGRRVYSDSSHNHFAIPPLAAFAYARSPAHNKAYFDPTETYQPWASYSGATFNVPDPASAPTDPTKGAVFVDLTSDIQSSSSNEVFKMYPGMVIPTGTVFTDWNLGNTWQTALLDVSVDNGTTGRNVGIKYFPATFYLPTGTTLPTELGYLATGISVGAGSAPDGSLLDRYEIKPVNFTTNALYTAAIENFATWFTYYRKRHAATRGGIGAAFSDANLTRVGSFTINNRSNVTMLDLDVAADREDFYDNIYGTVGSGGTPNRQAMKHLGEQFMRTDGSAPVTHACQQNFGILFTDGYSTLWTGADVGNADGDNGDPYADDASNTIADIAMHYYENPLRTDLPAGQVPAASACSSASPPPELDCNRDLHMVTFGVTLGQKGNIYDVDAAATADPYANPPNWPDSFNERGPSAIDDLWHAAINGRGQFLNAATPHQITDQFRAALSDIAARAGSSSSVAINTGSISSNTRLFQASFESGDWTGHVMALPISNGTGNASCSADDPFGALCPPIWDASCTLSGGYCQATTTFEAGQNWDTGREILTWDPLLRRGIPFRLASLVPAQIAELNLNELDNPDTLGALRLDFLRGNRSDESGNGGAFRTRLSIMGDVVHSNPTYVGEPDRLLYPQNWDDKRTAGDDLTAEDLAMQDYSSFRTSYLNRTEMVYVGANDGMLHGFDADTGEEKLAYVPSVLFSELRHLTQLNFQHRYYVDGTPSVIDALISGVWKSVLVGGLGVGGQAVYALDVTDPSTFDEANSDDLVLWEFGDIDNPLTPGLVEGDADLGVTVSQPTILRMHDGRWAAVFGNGYNNTELDASFSLSGDAALYIVDLASGALIKKLSTGTGMAEDPTGQNRANGLGTVTPADLDGDLIVDYVYAGDLFGNVWKFDLTSTSASSWSVAYGTTAAPEPLFTASDGSGNAQPITTKIEASKHHYGIGHGVMLHFGTGKYIEVGDAMPDTSVTQSFYALWDTDVFSFAEASPFIPDTTHGFTRSRLQAQTITEKVLPDGRSFRLVSDNPVDWASAANNGSGALGWVLNLQSQSGLNEGEVMVADPVVRGRLILFGTLKPDTDACARGGHGYFMALNAASGGPARVSPFDVNGDGLFSDADKLETSDDVYEIASGVEMGNGAPGTPGFVLNTDHDIAYVPLTNAEIIDLDINVGYPSNGRRNWRELR